MVLCFNILCSYGHCYRQSPHSKLQNLYFKLFFSVSLFACDRLTGSNDDVITSDAYCYFPVGRSGLLTECVLVSATICEWCYCRNRRNCSWPSCASMPHLCCRTFRNIGVGRTFGLSSLERIGIKHPSHRSASSLNIFTFN